MLDIAAKSNGMSQCAQKLVLDFAGTSRRGDHMDDADADLVAQLCARAGMIMEDISPDAITLSGRNAAERGDVIDRLVVASERVRALVQAAKLLAS